MALSLESALNLGEVSCTFQLTGWCQIAGFGLGEMDQYALDQVRNNVTNQTIHTWLEPLLLFPANWYDMFF